MTVSAHEEVNWLPILQYGLLSKLAQILLFISMCQQETVAAYIQQLEFLARSVNGCGIRPLKPRFLVPGDDLFKILILKLAFLAAQRSSFSVIPIYAIHVHIGVHG